MAKKTHDETPDVANRNIAPFNSAASCPVTELEGVILGIVWSRQPCSPYAVLSRFRASPTWGWSSSTGAIYPAIRRLKARGLLDHRPDLASNRKAELLSLSEKGLSALRTWIASVTEEMGSPGIDPIRTKINYLAALAPTERDAFLDRAEQVTRLRLDLVRKAPIDLAAVDNWTLKATHLGVESQLEARLNWLRLVRQLADQKRQI